MPRYYKKTTNKEFNPGDMKQAVVDVLHNNFSLRRSAQKIMLLKAGQLVT